MILYNPTKQQDLFDKEPQKHNQEKVHFGLLPQINKIFWKRTLKAKWRKSTL